MSSAIQKALQTARANLAAMKGGGDADMIEINEQQQVVDELEAALRQQSGGAASQRYVPKSRAKPVTTNGEIEKLKAKLATERQNLKLAAKSRSATNFANTVLAFPKGNTYYERVVQDYTRKHGEAPPDRSNTPLWRGLHLRMHLLQSGRTSTGGGAARKAVNEANRRKVASILNINSGKVVKSAASFMRDDPTAVRKLGLYVKLLKMFGKHPKTFNRRALERVRSIPV